MPTQLENVKEAIKNGKITEEQIKETIKNLACCAYGYLMPGKQIIPEMGDIDFSDCGHARFKAGEKPLTTHSSLLPMFPNSSREIPFVCQNCKVFGQAVRALANKV